MSHPPISHREVVETILSEKFANKPNQAKGFKSDSKAWCRAHGLMLEDPAALSLGDCYEERLREFLAALQRAHPGQASAGKNVRTAASTMRRTFVALLATQGLPADFSLAFRQAMDAAGLKPADLNRILRERYFAAERKNWHGSQIWNFYDGTAVPGSSWHGDSRLLLSRAEEVLHLQPDTLVSRAYPKFEPILLGSDRPIPWRKARSAQSEYTYALPKLPTLLNAIWLRFVDWRFQRLLHTLGKSHAVDPRSYWTSPATAKRHLMLLLRYFGWLCLPASTKAMVEMTQIERWQTGRGMKPAELTFALLFNENLLLEYFEYARSRQHNGELTKGSMDLLTLANSFASTPWCFLRGHPELAHEFGLPTLHSNADWDACVDDLHQRMLRLIRQVKVLVAHKQRSPDEPLRHVLDSDAPFQLIMKMLEQMEKNEPLKANAQSWSMWARDIAIIRMQCEVPLRNRNLISLRLTRHLTRKGSHWHLFVPKSELKNHYSKHAEDINRVYSRETSDAMSRYCDEARPRLVGATESSVFILGPACGRRANLPSTSNYELSTDAIYSAIGKHLERYFGNRQGMNFLRHLLGTAILKDDPTQVDVAAAILNNSPNAIRANYKHLTQADGLRRARDWYGDQAAKYKRGGKND